MSIRFEGLLQSFKWVQSKKFRVLALIGGFFAAQILISWSLSRYELWEVEVLKVYDGDTVLVKHEGGKYRVRLLYVDAPETDQTGLRESFKLTQVHQVGELSTNFLKKLIHRNQIVLKVRGKDRYGRLLGVLYLNRKNLNYEMVKAGMVFLYRGAGFRTQHNKDMFEEALAYAKRNKKGFWKFQKIQNPSSWRRYKKKTR